jgi:Tetratricopeptide repeat
MATEFRRRLRAEARKESAPMQTGAHQRLTESSEVLERSVVDQRLGRTRGGRPSIRPSAFGIPRSTTRTSTPAEHAEQRPSPGRISSVPAAPDSLTRSKGPLDSAGFDEPPRVRVSQTVRKRDQLHDAGPPAGGVRQRAPVKTDIEELLPISQGVKSLPRPPRVPTFEAPSLPAPTTRRFPWMSLSIFAIMLGASLASVARYRVERTTTSAAADAAGLRGLREVDWASLAPAARTFEHTLWGEPASMRETLLEDGEHALAVKDVQAAEGAFTRALAFGVDDPSAAFGLARVKFAQGDLQGARGWAETALRRRPLEQRYHSFLEKVTGRLARTRHGP